MVKARRIKGIDCHAAAGAGIKLVLVGRFREMSQLRSAAVNWKDLEGVHSMRVASRRLRSALHDFTPYLKKRGLASSLKQIRHIADTLGKVRDQDVAILALEQLSSNAPAEVSAVLSELIHIRQVSRDKARQQLEQIITKTRLKQLGFVFSTAVDASSARGKPKSPTPTYIEIARSIILERLKELEKLSNSLYRPLKVKPLHKMRIAAKRLRYAIELFKECWGSEIEPFAEEVARLQQSLGDLHDCDVWIESFGDHIIESKKKDADRSDEFAWLLRHFFETRNRHFSDAFDIWREWEARGFSAMLRDLISPAEEPATPAEVTAIPIQTPVAAADVSVNAVEVLIVPAQTAKGKDPAKPSKALKAKTAVIHLETDPDAS